MATIGNWVVSAQLKFTSNVGTEVGEINKALKGLRDGEISRTQKAFKTLGESMLTLGKKMDADGKIQRNVFNSLSKGFTKITEQTKVATTAVGSYAEAFDKVKIVQNETFKAVQDNSVTTGRYLKDAGLEVSAFAGTFKGVNTAQADTFDSLKNNISSTTQRTNNATKAMLKFGQAVGAAGAGFPGPHMPFAPGAGGGMGGGGGRGGGTPPKGPGGGAAGNFGRWFFGGGHNVGQFASAFAPGMLAGGLNAYTIGFAVKEGFTAALHTNAGFQTAFLTTSSIMGASKPQQDLLYNSVMAASGKTGIGPTQMMEMARDIGRLTTGTMSTEQSIGMIDPMAKYAKILELTRHMTPEKSVDAALETMHLLRDYSPQSSKHLLDLVTAMGEMMPQDPLKTVTQLKQFAPALKNMGVPDAQIATMMVFAARAGMGTGRGGTGIRETMLAALNPNEITSHLQALKQSQSKEIFGKGGGEAFYHPAKGKDKAYFDSIGYLSTISTYAQKHPGIKIMRDLFNVFGKTGGTFANLLADPQMRNMLLETQKAMTKSSISVDSMFNNLLKYDFGTQAGRLSSAWESLEIETVHKLMPAMASVMGSMADGLHDLQAYIHKHPAMIEGMQKWIKSFGVGIRDFVGFIEANPGFVQGAGEFAKFMAIMAGVRLAGSILGIFGKLLFIPQLFTFIAPMIRALTLAGAISGSTLAATIGLPLAVGAVIAAIGMAIFFPKQFEYVKHVVAETLKSLAEWIVDKVLAFIHRIADDLKGGKWRDLLGHITPPIYKPTKDGKGSLLPGDPQTGLDPMTTFSVKALQWLQRDWAKHDAPSGRPGVRHNAPHAQQHAQANGPTIHVAFTGPIYGMDDFKKKVSDIMAELAKNPMSALGTNLSPTRTHPNIPQVLTVGVG